MRPIGGKAMEARFRQEGLGLVEVMVGMVIGMLAVIVTMQVFSVSEANKRSTTGGADATTNGAIALYQVEREVGIAGWGLDSSLYLGRTDSSHPILPGCATLNHYCSGNANCKDADWSLAPVSITDGGTNPDTITIRHFANPDSGNFVPATTARAYVNTPDADSVPRLKVSSNFGCKKGDLVLVADPAGDTCTLIQVSDEPDKTSGNNNLPHKSDGSATSSYNNPDWDVANGVPFDVVVNSTLATCFTPAAKGPTSSRSFSVDRSKGVLQRSDTIAGLINETSADGIVDLQAQYGVTKDDEDIVSSWVDATTGWENPVPKAGTSGTTTGNRLQNIRAIRIALLARSAQYEKPTGASCDATTGNPGTPGASGWSSWATFNTANFASDWRCYRYRAFEIIVPVRNIIWGNS